MSGCCDGGIPIEAGGGNRDLLAQCEAAGRTARRWREGDRVSLGICIGRS